MLIKYYFIMSIKAIISNIHRQIKKCFGLGCHFLGLVIDMAYTFGSFL